MNRDKRTTDTSSTVLVGAEEDQHFLIENMTKTKSINSDSDQEGLGFHKVETYNSKDDITTDGAPSLVLSPTALRSRLMTSEK